VEVLESKFANLYWPVLNSGSPESYNKKTYDVLVNITALLETHARKKFS